MWNPHRVARIVNNLEVTITALLILTCDLGSATIHAGMPLTGRSFQGRLADRYAAEPKMKFVRLFGAPPLTYPTDSAILED
jgi:hypothetical protein